jgi:two-component system, chemotaxis family, sensor kinase CheA
MEQFKQKFIDEAIMLVVNLETVVLELDADSGQIEQVREVFRVMHTLKGVSGMYGFDAVSEYTHHLENIYDHIREGRVEITKEILNLTFESIDHIKNLLSDETLSNPANSAKHFELMYKVSQLSSKISKEAENKTVEPYGFFEDLDNNKTYYIIFTPDDDLMEQGVNLLEIFNDLSSIGTYRILYHNFTDGQNGKSTVLGWGIYLVTNRSASTIEDILVFIIGSCRILKIANFNLFDKDEFNEKFIELKSEKDQDKSKQIQKSIIELIDKYNDEKLSEIANPQQTTEITISPKLPQKKTLTPEIHKPETPPQPTNEKQSPTTADTTETFSKQMTSRISVDSAKLDTLMYLVSELVTTKAQLSMVAEKKDWGKIDPVVEKIDKLTKGFRDNALSIRLIPINDLVFRFKRLIRDLAQKLDKNIRFVTNGTETELDKSIIDSLADPIMHIIRNAVDHGIELPDERQAKGKDPQGTITFSAFHSGTNIYINIQDDGKGVDTDKLLNCAIEKGFVASDANLDREQILELVFIPGLTTANNLSDISGRGVGMDVVKRKIAEVRGEVEIESTLGLGTSITIKLQQTISIIDTLLIKAAGTHFMIPLSEIDVCDQRAHAELFQNNNRFVSFDHKLIPFIHLRTEFGLEQDMPRKEKIVFVTRNETRFAIVADKIIGEHQAVLKPLGKMFRHEEFLSGVSVLGDGSMALMLDTGKLIQIAFSQQMNQ